VVSIDRIIKEAVNPFDSTTFRPGNFWQEEQDPQFDVDSIHRDILLEVENCLDCVVRDRRTRTLLLAGDSGSGKSYLLGRIKRHLNRKAFFSYVGPWPESDFIWRHTLRNTVDSLMFVPEGEKQSQLLLWIERLPAFKSQGLMKQVFGERKLFIHQLKGMYPSGIYNANEFFGVLYDLTDPELYPIACEWLKGDDLDEESLKALRVKRAIDTEDAAQKMLANFGKIAAATQPIVLCFDNLDNIDRALDGFINLQALFNVNSIVHNQKLNNFLIVISIITNTWKQHSKRVQAADLARIDVKLRLRPIDLDQAEALLAMRLRSLHAQVKDRPRSPIYPILREDLEAKFPGGKTLPRFALMLGRDRFQAAKNRDRSSRQSSPPDRRKTVEPPPVSSPSDPLAAFKLVWLREFDKTRSKITRVRQFAAPELIQMLREAMEALQIRGIQTKLLPSPTYASYSLSYHLPDQLGRIGLVWTEDPNLIGFFHVMKACEKVLKQGRCKTLYLVRAERLGTRKNQGNKLYSQIFTGYPHRHILTDMLSVHYLATYHSLVNAACAGELVVGDRTPNLRQLQALVRESQALQECPLLQTLGLFAGYTRIIGVTGMPHKQLGTPEQDRKLDRQVKEFLLALVKTQQIMGRHILLQNALDQFPEVDEYRVDRSIEQLCRENEVLILDESVPPRAQLLCVLDVFKR
jgi:hypothetical protein